MHMNTTKGCVCVCEKRHAYISERLFNHMFSAVDSEMQGHG